MLHAAVLSAFCAEGLKAQRTGGSTRFALVYAFPCRLSGKHAAAYGKNLPEIKNEEGSHDMCKAIDDMIKEGIEKKLKQQIKKQLSKGRSVEVIADELDEECEVIEKLIAEMKTE